ncbi:MAG: sigma-70 family RNA polymerase sigma factor [Muribaculaceae bacterium]|nr:sigma-70 family RNA polymerase sigma factor [Muribaculaceae bacterium]
MNATTPTRTDGELVKRYIAGDDRAFDTLLARHSQRIFSQIKYLVKDNETANDLFQETFFKVITHLRYGRYREEGKFQGWLSRVANNIVMDYFRQKPEIGDISTDDTDVDILNREELAEMPVEHTIVSRQVEHDATRIMQALPETQREIIEMRFYLDMSFKEIAEKKGMSINTALGRMHYAVKNMRRLAERHNITLY